MARPQRPPRLEQNSHGIYEIRWTENRRSRRISTHARSLQEAGAFLNSWTQETNKKICENQSSNISEILDVYWHARAHDTVSAATTHSHLKLLKQALGSMSLGELSSLAVQTYARKRRKGLLGHRPVGDATIRRELTILNAAINHAVAARLVSRDTAPTIALPPASPPRERYLELSEIEQLFASAASMREGERLSRIERFLALALFTGARKEAIVKLTWDRIDLEKRLIDYRDPGLRVTRKRRATVPVSDDLQHILERAYRERKGAYVLDTTGPIRSAFERTVARAGLEDVTPHTLRHTWASHASMNGVALTEVARVLGNTLAVCERVYAKFQPGYLRAAVNAAYGGRSFAVEERAP